MLTFLLSAESCEKITLGITVFLSYSFLIAIVADSTPQTGAQPRLGNSSAVFPIHPYLKKNVLKTKVDIFTLLKFFKKSFEQNRSWNIVFSFSTFHRTRYVPDCFVPGSGRPHFATVFPHAVAAGASMVEEMVPGHNRASSGLLLVHPENETQRIVCFSAK